MTVHNLIDLVTTNLGLRTDPEDKGRQSDPPQPSFHISQKDHFVHPLPGTYPRVTRLSDGSILFAFTHLDESVPGSPPTRSLKIARSIDNGKTFTPHGEVTSGTGDIDNMFLLQLPASSSSSYQVPEDMESDEKNVNHQPILAAFRNHDVTSANQNERKYTHHRITICQSLDNGRKWEFLSQAVESSPPCGLWEPFMRMSKSRMGELQLFYSGELGVDDQDTFLTISRDWGRSWDRPRAVTGFETSGQQVDGEERLRDGMVGIAETVDVLGREALVMVLETTRDGSFVVECVVSYDDGLSWGTRQSVYVAEWLNRKTRRNAGAPQVASFEDGEVAVVFMTDEDGEFEEVGEGMSRWPLGAKIKALFGGRPDEAGRIEWREDQRPRDVSSSGTALVQVQGEDGVVPAPAPGQDMSSLWPGVMRLEDDKLLVVYETGGIVKGRVITRS